jgi:hypothetical protein
VSSARLRPHGRSTAKRRYWVRGVVVAVVALALSATVAARLSAPRGKGASSGGGSSLSVAATLPPDFTKPLALIPDPSGDGVWFWAESASDARVFFVNSASHAMQSWSLGNPLTKGLLTGNEAPIAVGTDVVWVGANRTLAQLTPSTGAVNYTTIPELPQDTHVVLPQGASGFEDMTGLGLDSSGDLAIAVGFTSTVLLRSASSGAFEELPLDAGTMVDPVALLDDQTLGILAHSDNGGGAELVEIGPSGSTAGIALSAVSSLGSSGGSFMVTVQGLQGSVSEPSMRLVEVPAAQVAVLGAPLAHNSNDSVEVQDTTGGIVATSGGQSVTVALPDQPCEVQDPVTRAPSMSTCPTRPMASAVDANGDVWIISVAGPNTVLETSPY